MITEHDLNRKDKEIALLREVEKETRALLANVFFFGDSAADLRAALDALDHFDRSTETARRLAADLERMGVR